MNGFYHKPGRCQRFDIEPEQRAVQQQEQPVDIHQMGEGKIIFHVVELHVGSAYGQGINCEHTDQNPVGQDLIPFPQQKGKKEKRYN